MPPGLWSSYRPVYSCNMATDVTVLCLMGPDEVIRLSELFPGVSFVSVPPEGDVPAEIRGEILLVGGSGPNLRVALTRGVKWIHTVATGIDHFPLDVLSESVIFTNSRGAGGIAIS